MKKKSFFIALIIFLISTSACFANGKCQTIHAKEGRVYKIRAALYKGTHIQLPERMIMPPQPGDKELWTVEGNGHHVMIQPNNDQEQGRRGNLTLIGASNRAYHFELIRVSFKNAYTCVEIVNGQKFFEGTSPTGPNGHMGTTSNYRTPEEVQQMGLEKQIMDLQKEIEKERKSNMDNLDDAIAKYRSMIYTRYEWDNGSGFKGRKLITDVWDDGRFTFIRVMPDHRGLMAAKAKVDGKEEMIEYKSDSDNVYKISGIFPELTLLYGQKNKVKVKRADNQSNGVY